MKVVIAIAIMLLQASAALAHSQSYGYLAIDDTSSNLTGRLELALRDLDQLVPMDTDGNGQITWGEIRKAETAIATQALGSISLSRAAPCTLTPAPTMIDQHGGEPYLVMPFAVNCPDANGALTITYNAMFDRDAQHRGLVAVTTADGPQSFVTSPETRSIRLASPSFSGMGRFTTFVTHGMHHLWMGYDHMLFLITMLLSTVLQARGASLWRNLTEAAKVVTAFTLSHSVTLALAALGLVSLPSALTESLIAVTIALAALNNIWPVVTQRVWLLALGFGLVHGLGFANVLGDLGLETSNLVLSLLGFNLGVELAQLAVVAIALPLLLLILREQPNSSWRRATMPAANLLIFAMGAAWFSDRALGTALLPL